MLTVRRATRVLPCAQASASRNDGSLRQSTARWKIPPLFLGLLLVCCLPSLARANVVTLAFEGRVTSTAMPPAVLQTGDSVEGQMDLLIPDGSSSIGGDPLIQSCALSVGQLRLTSAARGTLRPLTAPDDAGTRCRCEIPIHGPVVEDHRFVSLQMDIRFPPAETTLPSSPDSWKNTRIQSADGTLSFDSGPAADFAITSMRPVRHSPLFNPHAALVLTGGAVLFIAVTVFKEIALKK